MQSIIYVGMDVHTENFTFASYEFGKGDVFAVMDRLAAQGNKFDMVFCDPPYHLGLWERALTQLDNGRLLNEAALVIVEQGGDENELPDLTHLKLLRNQRYGKTTQINIFEYKSGNTSD